MAQCPVCQKQIQASFGMILCPTCQTPLFFDFDGNPQAGDSVREPAQTAEVESIQNFEANFVDESPANVGINFHEEKKQINKETLDFEGEINSSFKEENNNIIDNQEPQSDYIENQEAFDLNAPLGSFQGETFIESMNPNLDLIDDSPLTNGQFLYDIEIEGIDGSKLRNELYEELKDPRWGWVAIELMGAIKVGRLILKDVNAVKASLLVNRLKALPLEIKWKQNG